MNNYLKPHKWTYLREMVERSQSLRLQTGTFKITSGINKPRHVFTYILNDARLNNQTQNPAAPLATGALSGLSSLGVNKLFGSGLFSVPQDKVDKLVKYKDYLTTAQKKQIVEALQTGSGIRRFKLTNNQHGGFLGTLLASIGVPLLLNALTGKGLQVDSHSGFRSARNVYVPRPTPPKKPRSTPKSKGGLVLPYQPPPFIGTWEAPVGMGVKKPKKKRNVHERKRETGYSSEKTARSVAFHS